MLEYIYFVKCPGCDDEPFHFFNEAKDFAMSLLSQKPIITQIEVDRNDFGECTNSADLGTIWSWEDMMQTDDEPAKCIFTKDDLACTDSDTEFDALDNSLDSVPDNFRKPVPADMTIDDLVEEMEKNEDDVECKGCGALFDKSECIYDKDYRGWLCWPCQQAVIDHGGNLNIGEAPLDEAMDPREMVELDYPSLTVTLYGPKRDVDDWDEVEHTTRYTFLVPKVEVATAVWENWITEEDVKDVEGGLETLEDDEAWEQFLETHFDDLFEKYNKQILEYFKEEAAEDFRERSQEEYDLERWAASSKPKSYLEELEEAVDYRKHLVDCPECGVSESFDHKTGICINCGFNI